MTTTDGFKRKLGIISSAGVGVIMVPTREPERAAAAICDMAIAMDYDYKKWSNTTGWEDLPEAENKPPVRDKVADVFLAMKKINDVDGDGSKAWPKLKGGGFYVMMYPHFTLGTHSGLIQCVKDYAFAFSQTKQRLIMIVPEETPIKKELENDITILEYGLPTRGEIEAVYTRQVEGVYTKRGGKNPFKPEEKREVINLCSGMTSMEVETAIARAQVEQRPADFVNNSLWIEKINTIQFIQTIGAIKSEVVKRSDVLEPISTYASVDDVGGMDLLKKYMLERATAFTEDAVKFGVQRPKGMSAIGPPGTGKTLFSKLVASLLRQRLVRLDIGAVFNKYVGESEARIRMALKLLRAMAPVVCLVDEVDKAGLKNSGGGDSGVGGRVVGTILDGMQEMEEAVYFVFTANRAEGIDPAMIRKGRLDEVFAVLPPNSIERREVFNIHLRKQNQKGFEDLDKIVKLTKGFVGAEIQGIVKEAVTLAFCRKQKMSSALLEEAHHHTKPLYMAYPEDFEKMHKWAQDNARASSSADPTEVLQPVAQGTTDERKRTRSVEV